jgi:thiamine kinase-like enzyme
VYAEDLKRLAADGNLLPEDHVRVTSLADYLAEIHAVKQTAPDLYHRGIRDLLGHGEGVMGMTDSYPPDFSVAPPARLRAIEKRMIDWRWQLRDRTGRLSQVHGDFHPWNILFQADGDFFLLDRSRGEWGEPADDVSAMSINYIFFALQRGSSYTGPYQVLFDLFWEQYLSQTQDVEISRVIQPFFAWRALVLAHPLWYPNLSRETREMLFRFAENVLEESWFDPKRINDYLTE